MPKCKRYVEEEKAKCGRPAAKRSVGGQLLGTFCNLCYAYVLRDTGLVGKRNQRLNAIIKDLEIDLAIDGKGARGA